MTDQDKKLVELHEKYDAKDQEVDALRAELEELKRTDAVKEAKHGRMDWLLKNPAMFTAVVTAVMGGAAYAENLYDRIENRKSAAVKEESKQAAEKLDDKTIEAVLELLLKKNSDTEELFLGYAEAIYGSLSTYQRRRIDRFLSENNIPQFSGGSEPPMDVGPSVGGTRSSAASPSSSVEVSPDTSVAPGSPLPASSGGVYQALQQRLKLEDEVKLEELEEILVTKGHEKRRKK